MIIHILSGGGGGGGGVVGIPTLALTTVPDEDIDSDKLAELCPVLLLTLTTFRKKKALTYFVDHIT